MEGVDVVAGPRVEYRAASSTLGIRETVPFRSMLSNRDRLLAELVAWLELHHIEPEGPFFLRLHVVDMAGSMDVEVGVVCATDSIDTSDGRVERSIIPAGRYALLDYRDKSLRANRMLWEWIESEGLIVDSRPTSAGDEFAARCELYLTDPRSERMKTRWVVQLAFLLRDTP